jgi:hypothetical protein
MSPDSTLHGHPAFVKVALMLRFSGRSTGRLRNERMIGAIMVRYAFARSGE